MLFANPKQKATRYFTQKLLQSKVDKEISVWPNALHLQIPGLRFCQSQQKGARSENLNALVLL